MTQPTYPTNGEFNREWYLSKNLCKPGQTYMVGARPGGWQGPWPELVVPFVLAEDYAALQADNERLTEALRTVRAFVQDGLDTSFDRSFIGNMMAARDTIDAALETAK